MGNCCDCFQSKQDGPTPKTPLLTSAQPPAVTVDQPEKTSAPASPRTAPVPPPRVQSARQNKPEADPKEFLTSIDEISTVEMKLVETVPSLDKTFQDHAKLYNDLYTNFTDLRQSIHTFKSHFESEQAGVPTIAGSLKCLAKRCGGAELTGSRSKNCIQIDCDRKEICEKCEGSAEEVLDVIETYNKANRLIRSLLEKSPQVRSSVRVVLEQESTLKREVTKADPDGAQGPEPLRSAQENFGRLRQVPAYIDTIQKYTNKTFNEIVNGSKVLFEEPSKD